jgi:hypothetical protein
MSRISALIFGHSHTWALKRALGSEFSPCDESIELKVILCGTQKFPGTLLCRSTFGTELLNLALQAALSDFPPAKEESESETWLISAVQGNYYNIVGMLDNGTPFDFVSPESIGESTAKNCVTLPHDAVIHAIATEAAELEPFLRKLKNIGYRRVIQLGAPPPNPSSENIKNLLANEPKLKGKALSVTSPAVRLKLWNAQEKVVSEICRRAGAIYLSAPLESKDRDGFLRSDLCKDTIHGTGQYASLVLTQVERAILKKEASS